MKLIILLAAIAWTNGDKLDKTYLPPSHARTSGGSGNFLQTPISQEYRGPSARNNGFSQNNGFAQNGNGFSRNGNGFSQNGNGFSQSGNEYSQNDNGYSQGNEYNGVNAYDNGNFEGRPERAQAAFERNAAILRQDTSNDGETYAYSYETENGISAEENGVATNGVEAQGGFSYTGDDGQVYSIRYTADQNGFVPQGDHLPTPPPVPEEILRALEQNARDEAAGIYDDGSYNEAKYNNGDQYSGNDNNDSGYNGNAYNGNGFNAENDFTSQSDDDSVVTNSALFRSNGNLRNNGNGAGSFRNAGGFGNGASRSNGASLNNGASNGVNNAYLPPSATQRNGNGRNGFGSRNRTPTYNQRDGYRF